MEFLLEWRFFDIGLASLNLFSFVLGMMFAFFRQGLFVKRIGKWIFLYFICLSGWYALNYYFLKQNNTWQPIAVPSSYPIISSKIEYDI
jgi:hypothetical protein